MSKRIAVYVRVSTSEQSTDLQLQELTVYLKTRGLTDFTVFEDKATGTNANRPKLKEMLRDARTRKIDIVVCWKLDRLFRSLKDLVNTLQELSELGVEFISLKDNIDLTTSSGKLLMHLLGAMAEFEASLIKERVRAGIANAKAKGKRLGRPNTLDRATVTQLRAQGMSLSQIANRLNSTKSGVSKMLKRVNVSQ